MFLRPASRRRTILYEAHQLTSSGGTGDLAIGQVACPAHSTAQAAGRLGYDADGLFGAHRGLDARKGRLNEVLAFDAMRDDESVGALEMAWRHVRYPINALGGLRPVEVPRSGLVIGPVADALVILSAALRRHASLRHRPGSFHDLRSARAAQIRRAAGHLPRHPRRAAGRQGLSKYLHHPRPRAVAPAAHHPGRQVQLYRLLMKLARTADHIVTVSEYSLAADIIREPGVDEAAKTNTYQAVDVPAEVQARSDGLRSLPTCRALFELEFREYFLFCGAIEPKKNVSRLGRRLRRRLAPSGP